MPPKAAETVELSPNNGRPIPNPEPLEAAILSNRSLAVRFEGGPWIRPTDEETRLYGTVLSNQPVGNILGQWFYQSETSGRVRFTATKDDKQNSRVGNDSEQNTYRRLFSLARVDTEPIAFTSILRVTDIKARASTANQDGPGEPIPAANFPIPADGVPIDIPPTPFAHAYSSKGLTTMTDKFPLLKHVNCSYLSTIHHAPTLLELKQHAQALAVLIYEMSGPGTNSAQVNNAGSGDLVFPSGEPFDWLNDLNKPYVNQEAEHSIPLTTLLNMYHHDQKAVRTTQICPLSSLPRTREAKDAGHPGLPYLTHEALTNHANECLEILDHEFSAEGGLLAILPDMENKSRRNLSERTLLGQYILFTQRLVQRVHELELKAANAADLLSGEKVIPDKMIDIIPGLNGTDGTRPVPVAYPQHKYVLANAGATAWDELTKMLNVKEKMDRDLHTYNVQNGLSASSLWESNRTMEFRSGLTHIDVITRYTRVWDVNSVTGAPTPIFIIPGYAVHPGITATREMESNPHVVQVIKPQYPQRLSTLEEKYEKKRDEYEDIIQDHMRLKQENEAHLETIDVQQAMYKDLQAENSYRRAEQQQRGVVDLAKFRNPVAEKEKKLDETQRDLDRKLLAAEFSLRDAQRSEKAAQGELEKLENWKEVEKAKVQAILQQNKALTEGVRAGYIKNAGIASIPNVDTSFIPLVDVTNVVPSPMPADFQGTRIYRDDSGIRSQSVINGVLDANVRESTAAERDVFYKRVENILTGVIELQSRPIVVLALLPGVDTYSPPEQDRPPPGDEEEAPDSQSEVYDWVQITSKSENLPVINQAMHNIGWRCRYVTERVAEWFRTTSDGEEVIDWEQCQTLLFVARAEIPVIDTVDPNWSQANFCHIALAMFSIAWTVFIMPNAPDGTRVKFKRGIPRKDLEVKDVRGARRYLNRLTREIKEMRKAREWDKARPELVAVGMVNWGYVQVGYPSPMSLPQYRWTQLYDGEAFPPLAPQIVDEIGVVQFLKEDPRFSGQG